MTDWKNFWVEAVYFFTKHVLLYCIAFSAVNGGKRNACYVLVGGNSVAFGCYLMSMFVNVMLNQKQAVHCYRQQHNI